MNLQSALKIQINNGLFIKLKRYLQNNWGAPFILGFILLLMFVTIPLFLGLSSLTEKIIVSAFCMLVTGVILQISCFIKHSGKNVNEVAM